MRSVLGVWLMTGWLLTGIGNVGVGQVRAQNILLDDFEGYSVGGVPDRWHTNRGKTLIPITPELMRDVESFYILEEDGNQFVRAATVDQAFRMILSNGDQMDWSLPDHPRIAWDWRAIELPEGAHEDTDKANDTGGAVYVIFSKDFLGRPRGIKYTYSSTLPVGTRASYGPLKVLVVASGLDGIGSWRHEERDLYADYQLLHGKTPPNRPIAIFLWGDSDTMNGRSMVDYDNVILLGQVGVE
jgi:Protein of unknown function (DUF3047)